MAPSPRHENTVKRVKVLLKELGHDVLENDDQRGKGGWKLPGIVTDRGIMEYTLDIFARLDTGAVVAIEIDYKYKNSPIAEAKKRFRDGYLKLFGITTIRLTPKMAGGMTAAQLQAEIGYWLACKRVLKLEAS